MAGRSLWNSADLSGLGISMEGVDPNSKRDVAVSESCLELGTCLVPDAVDKFVEFEGLVDIIL